MNKYIGTTKKSKKLFERANKVLPAGVSYAIRGITPHPFYVMNANGMKIQDVDGNVYTDYWAGHGALILGHVPKVVVEAVSNQLSKGTHYGFAHEKEVELAEKVVKLVPSADMIRYTNSGTEANMYAVRLARSHTGREKIIKMEGGWHGGYDVLHKSVHAPFNIPESAGLDPQALKNTLTIPFNDPDSAEKAVKNHDVSCIVVEPVMGAAGFIVADKQYLKRLREICDETNTLLVFDEVITGFRLAPGGAQEYYGVEPDITVLGKILGGGFPIGAFCGSEEIFSLLDHHKYPKMEDRSAHGGTFTGNPISTSAGTATLDYLTKNNTIKKINRKGEKIREELRNICSNYPLEAAVTGIGSLFAIHFQREPPRNALEMSHNKQKPTSKYYDHMLNNNIIYMSRAVAHSFICEPHTKDDINKYLEATEVFFKKYGEP